MRQVIWGCLMMMVMGVLGCNRPPAEPGTGRASQPPSAEQPECGSKAASDEKGTEWRKEYGSAQAKVLVEAYYPMSPKHGWVEEINERLVKRFPGQVRVVYINWWDPEGKEAFVKRDVGQCSIYLVNDQPAVTKSPDKGGWTEEDLIAAVRKAVQEAYGKDAVEKEPPSP